MFQKIWDWFVYSSKNADNISATLIGFVGTLIGIVTNVLVFGHITFIDPTVITAAGSQATTLIQAVFALITAIVTFGSILGGVIAFFRKIVNTLVGQNDVLNRFYK